MKIGNISSDVDRKIASNVPTVITPPEYKDHIFECSIPAFRVLDLDGRLADDTGIPMKNVEAALRLYEDILKKYPDYIEQFYTAAAVIINRSYQAPMQTFENSDEDLPF